MLFQVLVLESFGHGEMSGKAQEFFFELIESVMKTESFSRSGAKSTREKNSAKLVLLQDRPR